MSWKLAELKWRQELGLYQSRWEREGGSLPLERKQAIHAFESRGWGPRARDELDSARKRWKTSPERHHARLGTPVPPVSPPPAVTTPVAHSSPTFPSAYRSDHPLYDCILSPRAAIEADAAKAKAPSRGVGHLTRRSRSCSAIRESYPPLPPDCFSPRCTSPFRTNESQDSSSWLPALSTHTPHKLQPCEELTRLLDHVDSASSSDSETDLHSPLSALDFLQFAPTHGQERGFRPAPDPFQSPEIDCRENPLDLDIGGFRLLGNPLSGTVNNIVTATDSSETYWPTTVSKHNSSSTLLPRTDMPGLLNRPDGDGHSPPDTDDESTPVTMPVGGQVRPPVRRTTPIYQRFDQAHASITGSANGFRFPSSTAGTDSLNDVYARAMQEEPAPSGEPSDMPAAGPVSPSNNRLVGLPFQRTMSSDNEEHMDLQAGDDNPAGLHIDADDVALVPILRNGPRSSVVFLSSPNSESPSVAFVENNNELRERSSSFQVRPRTPLPPPAPPNSEADSTVGALVDEYGDDNEDTNLANPAERGLQHGSSSSEDQNTIAGTHVGSIVAQPPQHRAVPTAGLPPSWPLPEEPSTLPEGIGANSGHLSSSPPTYGTTAGLLNQDRGSVSALRQGVIQHPIQAALRTSSLYSSEMDELIARRGRSSTPFDQIGDPGPAVSSSSPRLPSPQPSAGEDAPPHVGQAQGFERTGEPSSSSGIGIAVTSTDDSVVTFINGSNFAQVLETRVAADDDAAWETTQGSNTQRNSAVPDVDLAFPSSSSSLGDRATSGWDPLSAARRQQFDEVEREFAGLMQAQRINGVGGITTSTPEHSAEIASSPRGTEQARPSTFLASPDSEQTITQAHIPQTHNNNQQSARSIAGRTPFVRTPLTQMPTPQNIVEMISDDGNDEEAAVAAERDARLAAIEAEIRRYEPRPDDVAYLREYPNARLTTDRRVLESENDGAFVRRQHRLSRLLLCLFTVFYHLGGFVFVNSMANNGPMARYALLVASLFGGEPINNIHHEDMALAERVENWLAGLCGVVVAALSGVLIAFLCGALK